MHNRRKCETIAVVCARPTQHKKHSLTWRLCAFGGSIKDILANYIRACKNISVSISELPRLKPVHDALIMRRRLLRSSTIEPNPGIKGVLLTMEEKKASSIAVESSVLPKSLTSLQMLTKQLKCASQTASKRLRTSNRDIQILSNKTCAQQAVISTPLSSLSRAGTPDVATAVDDNTESQILLSSPSPYATTPSAVISKNSTSAKGKKSKNQKKRKTGPKNDLKNSKPHEANTTINWVQCDGCGTWCETTLNFGDNDEFFCDICTSKKVL